MAFSSVHFDDGQMVVWDHAPTTSLYTDPYHWQMLEVVGRVFQFVAPQTVKATQNPLVNGEAVLAISKLSVTYDRLTGSGTELISSCIAPLQCKSKKTNDLDACRRLGGSASAEHKRQKQKTARLRSSDAITLSSDADLTNGFLVNAQINRSKNGKEK